MEAERLGKIEARNHILRMLNTMYPQALLVRTIIRCVIPIIPDYDLRLASKDLHYLADKAYVKIERSKLAIGDGFGERLIRLTAAGKEIADQIIDDPALEV